MSSLASFFSSGVLTRTYLALVAMVIVLINEYEIKYINKNGSLALPLLLALLQHHRLRTVVQEVH